MLRRPDAPKFWSVPREWQGETAFLVGGGPSVLEVDLELLRGRRIIAINSSYERVPFADFLAFGDLRWFLEHRGPLHQFQGRVVTWRNTPCEIKNANREILTLERQLPPGLATLPTRVVFRRTSFSAAINLAVHLGASTIVMLGLDGKATADGRTHHHAPHRWPFRPGCWRDQAAELKTLVEPLKQLGITMRNASPDSALDLWPRADLKDCL